MPRISVENGRVTSRDPSMLGEGELPTAQDCYYKAANPALWAVKGRAAFNSSVEASAVESGVYLEFDDGTSKIVTIRRGGTTLRIATAGETGTFADLPGFDASDYSLAGTATRLDPAHYRDQHTLHNGVDRPRVVSSEGTQMFLGMAETETPPTLNRDGGTGTGFTLTTGATIVYWIEERVKINGVVVKRSAPSAAARVTLTGDGTLDKPLLIRGTFENPDTTHWALFATGTDGAYPIGAEISEVAAAVTSIEDTRTGADPSLPAGTAFETVSVTLAGLTTNAAKYGPPPIATSCDIFEDALLANDVNAPSEVAFCFTDNIHAWPSIFRIKFETKSYDKVIAVRAFDNFGIVILRSGVWRINTLPKVTDQAFEPERVKAEISGALGGVSAKAVAKFSFGEGERLAYVSTAGDVVVTDGSRWSTISDDMDVAADIDRTQLSKCSLVNNPKDYRLEWTYVPIGATRATKTAFLHYHPSHAKPSPTGGLRAKMTWPINRDANDAFLARVNGMDEMFSCNEDGKVYRHDSGFSEPTGGGITMRVRTPDVYPADIGTHARCPEFWTHHQASAGAVGKVRLIQRVSAEPDEQGEANIPLDLREATPCGRQGEGEAFQFEFEISNPSVEVGLDYFHPAFEFAGKTEEK